MFMIRLHAFLLIRVCPDAASIDLCCDGQNLHGKCSFSILFVLAAHYMFSSVFRAACCHNTFKQALSALIHVYTHLSFTSILFCVTYTVVKFIKNKYLYCSWYSKTGASTFVFFACVI